MDAGGKWVAAPIVDRIVDEEPGPGCATGSNLASNAVMEPLHRIESRLTDLEIKACFTEDLVDALNRLVARQQDQIDRLLREVIRLKDQGPPGEPPLRSPRDDLPPHY